MRVKGKITSWNAEKGFGFIAPNNGGKQIFVHIKAFNNRRKQPEINQLVTYTISSDKQGRPCAEKVTRAGERLSKKISISVIVAALFLVVVSLSAITSQVPLLVLPFYLVVSLITFLLYAVDKSAAKNGSWRTQESTLHLFALVGGWPGAIVAQQRLRHKSKKQSFRLVFWVTVLLNFGVFIWLHTPTGAGVLQTFINEALNVEWVSMVRRISEASSAI